MSTPAEIATGLATALKTITGLRTETYLSDQFTPPVVLIGIDRIDFHTAMRDQHLDTFTLLLILARTNDRAALASMEGYMAHTGPNSIRAAVEADQSLGGVTASAKVLDAGPPAQVQIGGNPYISCPFTVECYNGG